MDFEIVVANLQDARHAEGTVEILDAYARDPIGGGQPQSADVRSRLIPELSGQSNCIILLAIRVGQPVGAAVCFQGFSTFAARPLLNIHDLAVLPAHQGQGIGQALLAAVEERARELGCCKVTLEVRGDNEGARRLYSRCGFVNSGGNPDTVATLFLEKRLS